jgi:CheY-like chemotaxis protein
MGCFPLTLDLGVKRILLADDDDDIRRLAKVMLTKYGCQVSEASDGPELIKKALEEQPEFLIVDVMLPEPNGYEAVAFLVNEKNFERPVLFYSAVAKDVTLFRAHKPKCPSAFMLKPFTEGELITHVRALLDH